jgi:hypothetical protein
MGPRCARLRASELAKPGRIRPVATGPQTHIRTLSTDQSSGCRTVARLRRPPRPLAPSWEPGGSRLGVEAPIPLAAGHGLEWVMELAEQAAITIVE